MQHRYFFVVVLSASAAALAGCSGSGTTNGPDASTSNDGGGSDAGDAAAEASSDSGTTEAGGDGGAGGCKNPVIGTTFAKCSVAVDGGVGVGQKASVKGVSCNDVCCYFGYSGCVRRAPQLDYDPCAPFFGTGGTCDDVFEDTWSSQCICKP
jgi:hypothetical protein